MRDAIPVAGLISARQHICYSAVYAIARSSVCPSVRPFVTRVDQSETVEDKVMKLSPQSSFLVVNLTVNFQRVHRERGRRMREG